VRSWRVKRSPVRRVDVTTETYYGTTPGTGTCESLWGHDEPFAKYYLKTLYSTHADYVSKVNQDVDKLVGDDYLTAADGHKITAQAARSRVP
jgi:Alpha/beta hydrolase domain